MIPYWQADATFSRFACECTHALFNVFTSFVKNFNEKMSSFPKMRYI